MIFFLKGGGGAAPLPPPPPVDPWNINCDDKGLVNLRLIITKAISKQHYQLFTLFYKPRRFSLIDVRYYITHDFRLNHAEYDNCLSFKDFALYEDIKSLKERVKWDVYIKRYT